MNQSQPEQLESPYLHEIIKNSRNKLETEILRNRDPISGIPIPRDWI